MNRIIPLVASFAVLAAAAIAQPAHMNYQGRLLDAGGQPLPNAAYTLEFNIYDSPDGGAPVWGPYTCEAVVANGRFNVILGAHDAAVPARSLADAFSGDNRFIEIKVDGGAPILPRQQVLSAPYALRAGSAERLTGVPQLDYYLPAGMVVPFAGPEANIPQGWLPCDGRPLEAAAYPRLYAAIGTAWGGSGAGGFFHLPDLRGMFLRGVNQDRADAFADPHAASRVPAAAGGASGNAVGSIQAGAAEAHAHQWGYPSGTAATNRHLYAWNTAGAPVMVLQRLGHDQIPSGSGKDDDYVNVQDVAGGFWTAPAAPAKVLDGSETRPNNAYVHYIIKH